MTIHTLLDFSEIHDESRYRRKKIVIIIILLALFAFSLGCFREVQAGTTGNLPIVCFTSEEFYEEYKNGDFEIVSKSPISVFMDGEILRLDQLLTQGQKGDVRIETTWLVDSSGLVCLLFMKNINPLSGV